MCTEKIRFSRFVFTVVLSLFGLLACATPPASNPNSQPPVSNTNTVAPASNSQPTAPVAPSAAAVPVTLPLIDALLSDEEYVRDLRGSLQLSDEELQKLRDISRNAVLQLDESEMNDARSTRTAATKAEKQVESILGKDRGDKFLAYVREHAAGDAASLPTAKPNAVPSDTRIVVNIPAYRMDVFQNGELKKTYAVGIGYPEFPLPVGLRKADKIIVNPEWTPPDEPWVKGKFEPYKKVEAGSKDNPLGPIKIPIGLPNLIHGGKAPSRIGTFASHGCVGLTNNQVKDFAVQLSSLAGGGVASNDLSGFLAKKTETKEVKLASAVPVELRYETIVAEDGVLHIYRDVYERGTNTEDNLRKVLDAAGVSFDSLGQPDRDKILAGIEQMAIDASGQPVDENDGKDNANSKKTNPTGKVTKNIKGKKEVTFELAALKGKGFPAPVALMKQ